MEKAVCAAHVILAHCNIEEGMIPNFVDGVVVGQKKIFMINHVVDQPAKWNGLKSVSLGCENIEHSCTTCTASEEVVDRSHSPSLVYVHQFMHEFLCQIFLS